MCVLSSVRPLDSSPGVATQTTPPTEATASSHFSAAFKDEFSRN
jgi:hypothetical protein